MNLGAEIHKQPIRDSLLRFLWVAFTPVNGGATYKEVLLVALIGL